MLSDAIIVALVGLVPTIVGPIITYKVTREATKRQYSDKVLLNSFYLVYCPLRGSIMNTHISSGVLRFPLSYRWSKAIHYFKKMKLGQGFKRLNNRFYDKPTYEVEYGKNFPFDEIEQIVKKNVRWSDAKLIKMIERADRATYESWRDEQNGELIEEKVELANYIFDIHEKLSRRLMPKA